MAGHVRHFDAGKASRQNGVAIAPGQRVDVAFDRGRRGRQHDGKFSEVAAHDRHVAALIMDAVVLFVALVVLFIDDDEPEFAEGQK